MSYVTRAGARAAHRLGFVTAMRSKLGRRSSRKSSMGWGE